MSEGGDAVDRAARMPRLRSRRLLRLIAGEARDTSLSRDAPRRHARCPACCMDLVLRARGDGTITCGLILHYLEKFRRQKLRCDVIRFGWFFACDRGMAGLTVQSRRLSIQLLEALSRKESEHAMAVSSNDVKRKSAGIGIALTVNGRAHRLELDPRTSLLDALRELLHLTGAKKGCDHGQCGACTVLVNGRRINSCLTLAVMHEDDDIVTIEGLGKPEALHPLQAAFVERDAFQCGYCTP